MRLGTSSSSSSLRIINKPSFCQHLLTTSSATATALTTTTCCCRRAFSSYCSSSLIQTTKTFKTGSVFSSCLWGDSSSSSSASSPATASIPRQMESTAAASTSSSAPAVDPFTMKIGDIKSELQQLGAEGKMWQGMEKSDLVELLVNERKAAASRPPVSHIHSLVSKHFGDKGHKRHASLRYGRIAKVGNTRNPTAIMSFCHGLGDTCEGWASGFEEEVAAALPHVLFILPTAPMQPVTMNMRMPCNAWYDIKGLGPRHEEDPEGVAISCMYVDDLVSKACEEHKIPRSRVVMGGFSQGAATSLSAGLVSKEPPAGVVCLSGYLAARDFVLPNLKNKSLPILMCHGTADPMVRLQVAEMSRDMLQKDGGVSNITFKTYRGMQHASCPEEMMDLVKFVASIVPPS